jgi:hypothetical protein
VRQKLTTDYGQTTFANGFHGLRIAISIYQLSNPEVQIRSIWYRASVVSYSALFIRHRLGIKARDIRGQNQAIRMVDRGSNLPIAPNREKLSIICQHLINHSVQQGVS